MLETIYLLGAGAYMGSRLVKLWQTRKDALIWKLSAPAWMKALGLLITLILLTAVWPVTLAVSLWVNYSDKKAGTDKE